MLRITIWNEYRHEKQDPEVAKVYPLGIHQQLAAILSDLGEIRTAVLDDPEHGLSDEVLDRTDVLIWWGHLAHQEVQDAIVDKVYDRIQNGMGVIFLHSAHKSKLFMKLMGSTANLRWRDTGEKERLWVVEPSHPIAVGLPACFELEREEMYGERFDVPAPDELIFLGWFKGGEVFRSGCCYTRGAGRVFYFQPGHEEYPTYYDANIQRVLRNAVAWAAPRIRLEENECINVKEPLEPLE